MAPLRNFPVVSISLFVITNISAAFKCKFNSRNSQYYLLRRHKADLLCLSALNMYGAVK